MEGNPRQRWTRLDLLVALVIVLFCALQIAIPTAMLIRRGGFVSAASEPRTGELPFSWQMYTVVLTDPVLTATFADGSTETVSLVPLAGELRARVAYDAGVLSGFCEHFPGAVKLTYYAAAAQVDVAC